ncbi:hypothetical protein [Streptomyces sp. SID1328]|uniref:hypothetical protein n=1 Tax=Streptomyces sp. SID1328 TaxID=2690250 RepID=UPI001F422DF3|nr:hypothetical protein [Streptomyces sp. SID1328]
MPTLIRQKTSKLCDDPSFATDPDLRYMAPVTLTTWNGVVTKCRNRFTPEQRATFATSHRYEYDMARVFEAAGVSMLVRALKGGLTPAPRRSSGLGPAASTT